VYEINYDSSRNSHNHRLSSGIDIENAGYFVTVLVPAQIYSLQMEIEKVAQSIDTRLTCVITILIFVDWTDMFNIQQIWVKSNIVNVFRSGIFG